jgi:hypothetical protein
MWDYPFNLNEIIPAFAKNRNLPGELSIKRQIQNSYFHLRGDLIGSQTAQKMASLDSTFHVFWHKSHILQGWKCLSGNPNRETLHTTVGYNG